MEGLGVQAGLQGATGLYRNVHDHQHHIQEPIQYYILEYICTAFNVHCLTYSQNKCDNGQIHGIFSL